MSTASGAKNKGLLWALVAYASASSIHHFHNASFLSAYPNMPPHLSMLGVYAAWVVVSLFGVFGYLLVRARYIGPGLILLAVYGACGLDALAHYLVADFSSHTAMMHSWILLEALTGLLLVGVCARIAFKSGSSSELSVR